MEYSADDLTAAGSLQIFVCVLSGLHPPRLLDTLISVNLRHSGFMMIFVHFMKMAVAPNENINERQILMNMIRSMDSMVPGCRRNSGSFSFFIPFIICFVFQLVLISLTLVCVIQSWRLAKGPLYAILLELAYVPVLVGDG
ncbi:hypothetical protein BD769DRAFT_1386665 [Suillus cothurnatus]|nr:hypothetical protein BD769DRAFT_1386665 [Suillus cothurnatus]